jgi:hypothetical protein
MKTNMRKLILATFLVVSAIGSVEAQQKLIGQVVTRPYNHKLFTDIDGSPFLYDDWFKGNIYFVGGGKLEGVWVKYDAFEDNIIYRDPKTEQEFDIPDGVKYFVLYPEVDGMKDSIVFRGGYPNVDDNTGKTFYEVLQDGKASLLKCYRKVTALSKQNALVSNKREFAIDERLYIGKSDVAPIRIKKDKASVTKALADKKDIIEPYIETQKKNCKSEESIMDVLRKYNEG